MMAIEPENWTQFFVDLKPFASVYKIALMLGRPVATVKHWAKGHEPRDSDARRLRALQHELTAKIRTSQSDKEATRG